MQTNQIQGQAAQADFGISTFTSLDKDRICIDPILPSLDLTSQRLV